MYDGLAFSQRLVACIEKSGMSRKEFSEKCKVPLATLNGHYNAKDPNFKINTETLYKYAKALDVSTDYLLMGTECNDTKKELSPQDLIMAVVDILKVYGVGVINFECCDGYDGVQITNISIEDSEFSKIMKAASEIIRSKEALEAMGVYDDMLNQIIIQPNLVFESIDQSNVSVIMKKKDSKL